MMRKSLKDSIGLIVKLWGRNNFFYEGVIIDCDDEFLKFNDRKVGIKILSLNEIKDMEIKK